MSINYNELLTNEQKLQILEGRLSQFASEAYQVKLNLATAQEIGSSEEQIEKIKANLNMLETAIKIHQEEIKLLS